jgi:hypothetical protein
VKITEIWRWPVKTMAGEKLQRVGIGSFGIEGDRVVHVEDARGRVITSRSHPRFLRHKGSLGPGCAILVDHRPWESAEVAAEVVDIAGPGAKLVRYDGAERFDLERSLQHRPGGELTRPSPTPPSGLLAGLGGVVARAAVAANLPADGARRAVQTPGQGTAAQPEVQARLDVVALLDRQMLETAAHVLTLPLKFGCCTSSLSRPT